METLFSPVGLVATVLALVGLIYAAGNPVRGLVLLVLFGTASSMFTTNLAVSGFGTTLILVAMLPRLFAERRRLSQRERKQIRAPVDWMFLALGFLALVHLVVGIARENSAALIAGDFYHLFFEIVLSYLVFRFFFRDKETVRRTLSGLSVVMLVFAAALLFLLATGLIRLIPGSGSVMSHTDFWRFRYSHHFPLPPLLLLIGLLAAGDYQGRVRALLPAIALVFAALVVSLKRTNWLTFMGTLLIIPFLQDLYARRRLITGGVLVVVVMGGAILIAPPDIWQPITTSIVADRAFTLTDTPAYEKGSSLPGIGNRADQARICLRLIASNPAGYGLGSDLQTLPDRTMHYIHNSFLHYGVHAGLPAALLLLAIIVRSVVDGIRLCRRLPPGYVKGSVVGSTLGLIAIGVTSIAEVTLNTFFFSMFVGFIYSVPAAIEAHQEKTTVAKPAAASR